MAVWINGMDSVKVAVWINGHVSRGQNNNIPIVVIFVRLFCNIKISS